MWLIVDVKNVDHVSILQMGAYDNYIHHLGQDGASFTLLGQSECNEIFIMIN